MLESRLLWLLIADSCMERITPVSLGVGKRRIALVVSGTAVTVTLPINLGLHPWPCTATGSKLASSSDQV